MAMQAKSYDIIGDIHGCADTLLMLLGKLGYRKRGDLHLHPNRQLIFLGDFVDRGPQQRRTIEIVRPMIESGKALSVMGNHEFNAIAYATSDPDHAGQHLRQHSNKNTKQHQAFLDEYEGQPDYVEVIAWFQTLPLWLDLGNLRVIHACWDSKAIERIGEPNLSNDLLIRASKAGTEDYEDIERLLKGQEIPLPNGQCFHDKDGNVRHQIRIRWWDRDASSFRAAFLGPDSAQTSIPNDPISGDHLIEYGPDDPPVFLGHYWLRGDPSPLADNIACVDYSVAKPGGKLVAYRWDGEQCLQADKFVAVPRQEPA